MDNKENCNLDNGSNDSPEEVNKDAGEAKEMKLALDNEAVVV